MFITSFYDRFFPINPPKIPLPNALQPIAEPPIICVVARGIVIGNDVNIQDGAVVHCTFEQSKTIIEDRVSVGHNAIIHGCHIKADVLVGMGTIIMDHAVVESNVLIAAGAVVLENSHLESGYIYAGVPAKKVKQISADRFNNTIHRISKNYAMYASWFTEDDTPKT